MGMKQLIIILIELINSTKDNRINIHLLNTNIRNNKNKIIIIITITITITIRDNKIAVLNIWYKRNNKTMKV